MRIKALDPIRLAWKIRSHDGNNLNVVLQPGIPPSYPLHTRKDVQRRSGCESIGPYLPTAV